MFLLKWYFQNVQKNSKYKGMTFMQQGAYSQ